MSVDYLRISVTDRCNLRCIYYPSHGRRAVNQEKYCSAGTTTDAAFEY
jgi:molybdenum cofactor biosynthesis enzyme MoaA